MISPEKFGVIKVQCSRLVSSDGENSVMVEFSNIDDEELACRLASWVNQLLKEHLQELADEVLRPASERRQ
jgi:hypothetical protein